MSDWNQQIIDEFRANGGTVTTMGFGRGLVLVHHLGARSGEERINPVANIREDDGSRLIAASAAGADKNPDWYHNLKAHPEASIEVGTERLDVVATELTGEERETAYATQAALYPGFADYAAKTDRVIPVVALARR